MNIFFILILVILSTRTAYYMLLHFSIETGLQHEAVDNQYLVWLYLQEIIFDFIILYNLVLKQGHEEHHLETQYRRATTFHASRPIREESSITEKNEERILQQEQYEEGKSLSDTLERVVENKNSRLEPVLNASGAVPYQRQDKAKSRTIDGDESCEEEQIMDMRSQSSEDRFNAPMLSPRSVRPSDHLIFRGIEYTQGGRSSDALKSHKSQSQEPFNSKGIPVTSSDRGQNSSDEQIMNYFQTQTGRKDLGSDTWEPSN